MLGGADLLARVRPGPSLDRWFGHHVECAGQRPRQGRLSCRPASSLAKSPGHLLPPVALLPHLSEPETPLVLDMSQGAPGLRCVAARGSTQLLCRRGASGSSAECLSAAGAEAAALPLSPRPGLSLLKRKGTRSARPTVRSGQQPWLLLYNCLFKSRTSVESNEGEAEAAF